MKKQVKKEIAAINPDRVHTRHGGCSYCGPRTKKAKALHARAIRRSTKQAVKGESWDAN